MRAAITFVLLVVLQACSSVPDRQPVPEEYLPQASIPGIPGARISVAQLDSLSRLDPEQYSKNLHEKAAQVAASAALYPNFLAISGGGSEGAFTAGLLTGWSESGTRPTFQIVSGVSTGALIAPFAFLGPEYDYVLETLYTTTSTENILDRLGLFKIRGKAALADTAPLRAIIASAIDDEFLRKVAREHRKGRRLIIGTTNLDSQTPVVWSMGVIADSGQPNALQLFQDVMLASASIPGVFPPVLIEVEANGQRFDEMHVDGGVSKQIFAYPPGMNMGAHTKAFGVEAELSLFLMRNSKIAPEHIPVDMKLKDIAAASASLLIKSQGNSNITETYEATRRDGVKFHLAYIPTSFEEEPEEIFDHEYMKKLFDLSYQLAREGYPWEDKPPWFERISVEDLGSVK